MAPQSPNPKNIFQFLEFLFCVFRENGEFSFKNTTDSERKTFYEFFSTLPPWGTSSIELCFHFQKIPKILVLEILEILSAKDALMGRGYLPSVFGAMGSPGLGGVR